MALIPKITKITLIILIVFLLSAIVTPVSADATILTHKDKRNLDIPDYFVPIKNFDMNPYLTPSSFINDILLKQCFRDDTCWKSLDAKTQSNVYKTAKIMITCFTLVITLQHGINDSILYINFGRPAGEACPP